jgi:Ca2+-binding EF-hand superfamily protein
MRAVCVALLCVLQIGALRVWLTGGELFFGASSVCAEAKRMLREADENGDGRISKQVV